jgi:hypothetical protein
VLDDMLLNAATARSTGSPAAYGTGTAWPDLADPSLQVSSGVTTGPSKPPHARRQLAQRVVKHLEASGSKTTG